MDRPNFVLSFVRSMFFRLPYFFSASLPCAVGNHESGCEGAKRVEFLVAQRKRLFRFFFPQINRILFFRFFVLFLAWEGGEEVGEIESGMGFGGGEDSKVWKKGRRKGEKMEPLGQIVYLLLY